MSELRTNSYANKDATSGVPHAQAVEAEHAPRICGNPAALKKAVFRSRDTRAVGLQASVGALMLMDRLRFVRTLDLAFHLYADRTFTAALAAANNLLKRLVRVRNGYVTSHVTRVAGMHIYGISQRGVNFLRDQTGHEGKAHRSLRDVKNPEHRLWANLIVITAEARGLTAMTESEVLRYERSMGEVVRDSSGIERAIPRKLLTIPNRRRPGERKGLTPDAILSHGEDRTFIELDASKRSSDRVNDLLELVQRVGSTLSDGTKLKRLVVLAKERRAWTHIKGLMEKRAAAQSESESRYLIETIHEGIFEVRARGSDEGGKGSAVRRETTLGEVQVLMLPDIRNKLEGWYDEDWLPYARHSMNC